MRIALPIFLIFFIIVSGAKAQTGVQDSIVLLIIEEFEKGDYQNVENLAVKALHRPESFNQEELFQIRLHLAFVYVARGDKDNSILEFKEALRIRPHHRFDQRKVSPKIVSVFNEALQEFKAEQEALKDKIPKGHIGIRASKRSLIFPGLGQLSKGESAKGYFLIGAETAAIASLIFTQWQYQEAHDEYKSARAPAVIEDRYDKYNTFYKLRNISAFAAAAIYIYSFLDCLYINPPEDNPSFSVKLVPCGVGVSINF